MKTFKILSLFLILSICLALCYFFFIPTSNKGTAFNKIEFVAPSPLHKEDLTGTNENNQENNMTNENIEYVLGVPISKKVNLSMTQSVQETNYYCVPACVQMILRHFGFEVSQESLAQEMKTHPVTGTEYVDMAITLNNYLFNKGLASINEPGYHIQTIAINNQDPQIAIDFEKRVIEDIDTSYPVFTAVNTQTLYPDLPPANHMILITGYALHKNSDRVAFYYAIDPYTKVQDSVNGGSKIFTSEELINAIILNEEPAYLW